MFSEYIQDLELQLKLEKDKNEVIAIEVWELKQQNSKLNEISFTEKQQLEFELERLKEEFLKHK